MTVRCVRNVSDVFLIARAGELDIFDIIKTNLIIINKFVFFMSTYIQSRGRAIRNTS